MDDQTNREGREDSLMGKKQDALLLEIRDQLRQLAPKKRGRAPFFRDYAEEWFSRYCRGKRKPGTLEHRRNHLRLYLLPAFKRRRIDDMDQRAIEDLMDHMEALTDQTRNDSIVILGMILREAKDDGWLLRLPRMQLVAVVRAKRRIHDVDTYRQIVAAAKRLSWRHHVAVLLCGDAGLRRSEVSGLEWVRVDIEACLIDVCAQTRKATELILPKSNRARIVGMTEELREALRIAPKETSRVIPGLRGQPIGGSLIWHLVSQATEAAIGNANGGTHLLRHTFATHLVDSGARVTAAQEMLGHFSLATTAGYLHGTPESIHDAVRLLSAKRSGQKT